MFCFPFFHFTGTFPAVYRSPCTFSSYIICQCLYASPTSPHLFCFTLFLFSLNPGTSAFYLSLVALLLIYMSPSRRPTPPYVPTRAFPLHLSSERLGSRLRTHAAFFPPPLTWPFRCEMPDKEPLLPPVLLRITHYFFPVITSPKLLVRLKANIEPLTPIRPSLAAQFSGKESEWSDLNTPGLPTSAGARGPSTFLTRGLS